MRRKGDGKGKGGKGEGGGEESVQYRSTLTLPLEFQVLPLSGLDAAGTIRREQKPSYRSKQKAQRSKRSKAHEKKEEKERRTYLLIVNQTSLVEPMTLGMGCSRTDRSNRQLRRGTGGFLPTRCKVESHNPSEQRQVRRGAQERI